MRHIKAHKITNYLLLKYVKYDSTRKQYDIPIIIIIALYSEIFLINNNIIYINLYGFIALFFINRFYRLDLNLLIKNVEASIIEL